MSAMYRLLQNVRDRPRDGPKIVRDVPSGALMTGQKSAVAPFFMPDRLNVCDVPSAASVRDRPSRPRCTERASAMYRAQALKMSAIDRAYVPDRPSGFGILSAMYRLRGYLSAMYRQTHSVYRGRFQALFSHFRPISMRSRSIADTSSVYRGRLRRYITDKLHGTSQTQIWSKRMIKETKSEIKT